MKKIILSLMLISILVFSGCKKRNDSKRLSHKRKVATRPVNVKVDTLKYQNLKSYLEFSSQPEGIVDITIYSQVSGKIVKILKKMGDYVKKDEVIAEIDNKDIQIQLLQTKANFESAKENFNLAFKQYQTDKNLFEKAKLISKAEYETSLSKYKSAEAAFNLASANLKKMEMMYNNSRFLAPEAGIINYLYIKKGEVISMGKPVCAIVDPSKLVIKAGVSQNDIAYIKNGQDAIITRDNIILKGKITAKGVKPIDRANYPIEITVDNNDLKILPGMIVKIKITKKVYKNVIAVSAASVLEEFGQKYVYLAIDNRAVKRFIKIGPEIADNFIITQGLKAGDPLIYQGLDNIKENSKIKVINGSK